MAEKDDDQQFRQVNVEEPGRANRSLLLAVTLFYAFGALFLLAIVTLWLASDILLLVFASILVAVFLRGTSNLLVERFKLPPKLSLPAVLLLIGIAAGLGGYFLIPRISAQGAELMTTLPNSVERLNAYLSGYEWFRSLAQSMPPVQELLPGFSKILSQARIVFSGMFTFLAKLTIVLFVGVYLAAQPDLYVNGFLKLFPPRRRNRAREVLYEIGDTLKLWLIGKLIGMIIVGTATSLALGLLGVPLAVTLGLITGLLNFIPYLGPLIAGIPMVLIAFSQGPTLALYTMLFYVVLQLAESYFLTPFVDRRTVFLPPALTITVQVFMGIFFGLLGITLATPLAASLYVLIAMLYVQDVLNDSTTMPSER